MQGFTLVINKIDALKSPTTANTVAGS